MVSPFWGLLTSGRHLIGFCFYSWEWKGRWRRPYKSLPLWWQDHGDHHSSQLNKNAKCAKIWVSSYCHHSQCFQKKPRRTSQVTPRDPLCLVNRPLAKNPNGGNRKGTEWGSWTEEYLGWGELLPNKGRMGGAMASPLRRVVGVFKISRIF